ncbi:MAG: hypothetical protein GKS01_17225 [Alphaproteobacteria bacterium]|nr:hypothetical protein [Alphaproteobacteria bacterium]
MTDPVVHAKAYPFPAPDHSYVFEAGQWSALDSDDFDVGGRTPVLAAGSNQSPEQLARKYADLPEIGPIPVIRGRLNDFDVVYAAHLAGYGSMPATFQNSPGTTVSVFVAWFTATQLDRMHATEGNYSYDRLTDVWLETDHGQAPQEVFAYTAKVGCYNHNGSCLSLAEISATNRKFASATQSEAQEFLRDRLAVGTDLDQFVSDHIADNVVRVGRVAAMRADAIEIGYPRESLLSL